MIFGVLGFAHDGFSQTAPQIADLQPIILHDGVNPVLHMTQDGRAGVIVRAQHSDSPSADGNAIDFMVLVPKRAATGEWVAADTEVTPSKVSDEPFGGVLVSAAPHTGEDWRRSIAFAYAKVDGAAAIVMIVGELDMRGAVAAYTPVPAQVSVFRLQEDLDFGDDFRFALIAQAHTTHCYVDVQLAVKDLEGLPLPLEYHGPKTSAACPPSTR